MRRRKTLGISWTAYYCIAAAVLISATACAQPAKVTLNERTEFGHLIVSGATNPFTEVKAWADFTPNRTDIAAALALVGVSHFRVPVVVTGFVGPGGDAVLPVYFTPPFAGLWTYTISHSLASGSTATVDYDNLLAPSGSGSFMCLDSTLPGWWRPNVTSTTPLPWEHPATYPHALLRPYGDPSGSSPTFQYERPSTTMLSDLFNPAYSSASVTAALDNAAAGSFNRIRTCLNRVTDRLSPNNVGGYPNQTNNHCVFPLINPAANFDSLNIDFNRFDLTQWSTIDAMIANLANRSMDAAITLVFNSGDLDYEEHYLYDPQMVLVGYNMYQYMPLAAPSSVYADAVEFYLWYVMGRLCTYTNVQYVPMHEWSKPRGGGDSDDKYYPNSVLADFTTRLYAIDPYLNIDPNWKIVSDNPGRGSLYTREQYNGSPVLTQPFKVGAPSSEWGTLWSPQLSRNVPPYLQPASGIVQSVVGLQRGGELGISSIVSGHDSLLAYLSGGTTPVQDYPCATHFATTGYPYSSLTGWTGIRQTLQANSDDRPIFVEEDWTARWTFDPLPPSYPIPSSTFANADNPYCKHLNGAGLASGNAFPFISNNYQGLHKLQIDQSWMAGVCSQSYLSYWNVNWSYLGHPTYSSVTSWVPHKAAQDFMSGIEWQRYTYAPGVVTDQWVGQTKLSLGGLKESGNPSAGFASYGWASGGTPEWPPSCSATLPSWMTTGLPTGISGRIPIEQSAVGCISDHTVPKYIIYCPASTEVEPGLFWPVTITVDMSAYVAATASPHSFNFQFMNPEDPDQRTPLMPGNATGGTVTFTPPPATDPSIGPFNEYVLLININ